MFDMIDEPSQFDSLQTWVDYLAGLMKLEYSDTIAAKIEAAKSEIDSRTSE